MTPTPAGERLFRGCKEILARFGEVEQEIREQATEVSGVCNVSSIYSVGLHELHQLQKELLRAHPKVNFRLNYRRSDQVYDDVILGAADLGLVAYPQARAGVDIIPFREDKLAVVMPPGHPLSTKAKVAMSALIGLPYVAFDREAPSRKGIDKLFRDKGLELQPTMEMDNVETIKRAVELGLGISVLPMPTVAQEISTGTLIAKPFVEGTFTRPIGILVRKGKYLSRASQAVLDAFRQATAVE